MFIHNNHASWSAGWQSGCQNNCKTSSNSRSAQFNFAGNALLKGAAGNQLKSLMQMLESQLEQLSGKKSSRRGSDQSWQDSSARDRRNSNPWQSRDWGRNQDSNNRRGARGRRGGRGPGGWQQWNSNQQWWGGKPNQNQGNRKNPFVRLQPQSEYRSLDGTGNNIANPGYGSTHSHLLREMDSDPTRAPDHTGYDNLPNPRDVSNAVFSQEGEIFNDAGVSDMLWQWGQFIDHDITLTEPPAVDAGGIPAPIDIPMGDPQFDPFRTGEQTMNFVRTYSEKSDDGQWHQMNEITAFIDGSMVYGSDQATADKLRSFEGGKMKTSEGDLLPLDETGKNFIAGDVRVNEQPGLTSMHTLFVREHNHVAEKIAKANPDWNDEQIYQEAKSWVTAEIQHITFNEFLPGLLGSATPGAYQGYDETVDPGISNEFATAAFRLGHSMISPDFVTANSEGELTSLALRDAFFKPEHVKNNGIDDFIRGQSMHAAQELDAKMIDDLRNFLFGPPGAGGMDLASLNIQRGRDHELPGYNEQRMNLGLEPVTSWDDPVFREGVGEQLASVYNSPDDIDLWVGGLAEKSAGDGLMGDTFTRIVADQFERLRAGDRFWYENTYSGKQLKALNEVSLADIIKRNSGVENIQENAMMLAMD